MLRKTSLFWAMVFTALFLFAGSAAYAGTLHLIVVADNDDEKEVFNHQINRDIVNVMVLARNAAADAGLTFSATGMFKNKISSNAYRTVTRNGKKVKTGGHWAIRNLPLTFDGIKFNRKTNIDRSTIRAELKKLKIKSDDVIWFHYTGHGFRWSDKKNKWPTLAISHYANKVMEFDEVLNTIKSSPARLKLAFADSCNSIVELEMPEEQKHSGARGRSDVKTGLKKLFANTSGYAYMGGSSPGQYGYGVTPQGGVFTYKVVHRIMIEAESGNAASFNKMASKFKKPINDFNVSQTPVYEFNFGTKQSGGGSASSGSGGAGETSKSGKPKTYGAHYHACSRDCKKKGKNGDMEGSCVQSCVGKLPSAKPTKKGQRDSVLVSSCKSQCKKKGESTNKAGRCVKTCLKKIHNSGGNVAGNCRKEAKKLCKRARTNAQITKCLKKKKSGVRRTFSKKCKKSLRKAGRKKK